MEIILAAAFGRQVDILRGESDELSESVKLLLKGLNEAKMLHFITLLSKFYKNYHGFIQALI